MALDSDDDCHRLQHPGTGETTVELVRHNRATRRSPQSGIIAATSAAKNDSGLLEMAVKSNRSAAVAAIAVLLAVGACARVAVAFPGHYAVAFEDEDEGAPPQHHQEPQHHAPKSYHFKYEVHDPLTGDQKSHNEVSDGHGTVTGTYTVVEPDGSKRVVEYTADDVHGFRAEVKKIEPLRKQSHKVAYELHNVLEHQKAPPPPFTPVHGEEYHYVPENYPSSSH